MLVQSLALLFLSLGQPTTASQPFTFQTRPDIHGDQVVYTAEGDLWLGSLKSGDARRLTSNSGPETTARFSPDGSQIAFVGAYDGSPEIYVMPTTGGSPTRLTFGSVAGGTTVLGWTPDGKSILCRAYKKNGLYMSDLYLVPASGGIPQKYPVPRAEFGAIAPDGQLAYVPASNEWMNWFEYKGGTADDIWLYNPAGKSFKQLTKWEGVDTTPVWAGGLIYFVSEKSGSLNLWSLDPKSGKQVQITNYTDKVVRYPGSDGRQIIFQVGAGLAKYDTVTGKTTELSFDMNSDHIHERQIRVPIADIVSSSGIGPSGKRIVIEARGQILSVPVEEGDVRVLAKPAGARCQIPTWSPDGKKIAYISDASGENEVWTMDASNGANQKQITKGLSSNPLLLKWSPNGKLIGLQDRAGQTMLIDAASGSVTNVDTADAVGSYDSFSGRIAFTPDSRLMSFQRTNASSMSSVLVYDVEAKKIYPVSPQEFDSSGATFSPDGKFISFVAATSIKPMWSEMNDLVSLDNVGTVYMVPLTADAVSPFIIKSMEEGEPGDSAKNAGATTETGAMPGTATTAVAQKQTETKLEYALEGLATKSFRPPIPAGRYSSVDWVAGKLLLMSKPAPVMGKGGSTIGVLSTFDIASKALVQLGPADGIEVSADGSKTLIGVGPKQIVVPSMTGPAPMTAIDLDGPTITINPRDEWRQIFQESWRVARDFFYDPGMHGVDWKAIRAKYESKLEMVGSRDDLTHLLEQLISELHCGHCYVGGPPADGGKLVPMGYLGADFEPAPIGVKITKLYAGDNFGGSAVSPLLQAGLKVKVGDYILAVAGQPVLPNQDIQALLVGTVGQITSLTVNDKPTLEGARVIHVKPLSMGAQAQLHYMDWVASRVEYVKKNAGEEFGYMHVPDMTEKGYTAFAKAQRVVSDKDAVVYDFRSNGGGNLSSILLSTIGSKPIFYFHPRGSKINWSREGLAPRGPIAALCDQDAFSDGELVIETWKKMGLGPVIGKRTGGGEVGSGGGYTLVDGGRLFIPNYGAFDPVTNKWIIEGSGATPDYEVDQDPTAVMAGKDPQLDKAIDLLKEKLKKNPRKKITTPPGKILKGS